MEKKDFELESINITQKSIQSLLACVENEESHMNRLAPSICMAPVVLRDLNPSSFNPRIVSIGPLHRDDKNVQAFEKQKVSYLSELLSRISVPKEEVLESCMHKVHASMKQIKECYVLKKQYDDAEIAKMMVTDACFILEFMLQANNTTLQYSRSLLLVQNVACDLVLLENQIPLFILDDIFQCTVLKFKPNQTLVEFISPILSYHNIFEGDIKTDHIFVKKNHHILSLLHQLYTPPNNISLEYIGIPPIPSVVDLDRAGVNFKPNHNPTWVMGIEVKTYRLPWFFWSWNKTTVTMPILKVHDYTEFILRNLIAYEHTHQTESYITSYAAFMDMLVNTQEDVAKLVDSKVLINTIGSNEEAASMINNICKEIAEANFFYREQWITLNKYYNSYWPKHIAWLKRTYFNSPWNIIALLAGIILFALTVVQTIFSVNPVGSNN